MSNTESNNINNNQSIIRSLNSFDANNSLKSTNSLICDQIIYETEIDLGILSSFLYEQKVGFSHKYKQWKPRRIKICKCGILQYKNITNDIGAEVALKDNITIEYLRKEILYVTHNMN